MYLGFKKTLFGNVPMYKQQQKEILVFWLSITCLYLQFYNCDDTKRSHTSQNTSGITKRILKYMQSRKKTPQGYF